MFQRVPLCMLTMMLVLISAGHGQETSVETAVETAPSPIPCGTLFAEYFSKKPNSPEVRKFLKIQAQVTLHRLGWAYLRLRSVDAVGIESVLKEAVAEQSDNPLYAEFAKKTSSSKNKAARLVAGSGALKDKLNARFGNDPKLQGFLLQDTDIEFLGKMDHAAGQFGYGGGGVVNFASMIDSSYHLQADGSYAAVKIADAKRHLAVAERKIAQLSAELAKATQAIAFDAGCINAKEIADGSACKTLEEEQTKEWSDAITAICSDPEAIATAAKNKTIYLSTAKVDRSGKRNRPISDLAKASMLSLPCADVAGNQADTPQLPGYALDAS